MLLRKVGPGLFSKVGNILLEGSLDPTADDRSSYPVVEEEVYISNNVAQPGYAELDRAGQYGDRTGISYLVPFKQCKVLLPATDGMLHRRYS